mmetsp:Transcript_2387/g.6923  ORF Transcript_2387/g.6923 Transcript_2387/m.6923 type:complete len:206 (+) Transcript_2387:827-1444(+)
MKARLGTGRVQSVGLAVGLQGILQSAPAGFDARSNSIVSHAGRHGIDGGGILVQPGGRLGVAEGIVAEVGQPDAGVGQYGEAGGDVAARHVRKGVGCRESSLGFGRRFCIRLGIDRALIFAVNSSASTGRSAPRRVRNTIKLIEETLIQCGGLMKALRRRSKQAKSLILHPLAEGPIGLADHQTIVRYDVDAGGHREGRRSRMRR